MVLRVPEVPMVPGVPMVLGVPQVPTVPRGARAWERVGYKPKVLQAQ